MKVIQIEDREIKFPESWNEVTMFQFIEYMKWLKTRPEKFDYEFEAILYSLELIPIFAFEKIELESFRVDSISPLAESLIEFISTIPEFVKKEFLVIEGVLYSFKYLDDLEIGEYKAYREIVAQCIQHPEDSIIPLLSIICRPATKVFDVILKKDVYTLSKFNKSDLSHRVELFEKQPAFDLMGAANFFLSGREIHLDQFTKDIVKVG